MFVVAIFGLITLMSTTCNKEEDTDPGTCNGYVSATITGDVTGNFCFTDLTTFTYQPNSYVTLWARDGDKYGFDTRLSSANDAPLIPGTYQCGSGEPGFVEFIYETESGTDNEFYKSKSGTLTVTKVNETSFEGSFNVVAEGYYNKETINYSGTFKK